MNLLPAATFQPLKVQQNLSFENLEPQTDTPHSVLLLLPHSDGPPDWTLPPIRNPSMIGEKGGKTLIRSRVNLRLLQKEISGFLIPLMIIHQSIRTIRSTGHLPRPIGKGARNLTPLKILLQNVRENAP